MAAAVADWRVSEIADHKVKKTGADTWAIYLVKNPDLIAGIHADRLVKVWLRRRERRTSSKPIDARAKIQSKGLHMIVANDITATDAGFAVDDNRVIILDREGSVERLPLMSKYNVGVEILDRVKPLLSG